MAGVRHRSAPSKRAKKALFVCVEGYTEKDYFDALRKSLRISPKLLYIEKCPGTSVINIASELKRARRNELRDMPDLRYDEFWGVVDTEWKNDWKSCAVRPQALKDADSRSTLWAVSSASFERWILLHFESNPPKQSAHDSANYLGRYLPSYSSDNKRLDEKQCELLLGNTEQAMKNAATWREHHESEDNFTDVDLLVRSIMDMQGGRLN